MEGANQILGELEKAILELKVDFDRFFNGALPIPPERQQQRLKRLLLRARSERLKTFAERFLLNTLEARFNTLNELYNRRLREREMGGTEVRKIAPGAAAGAADGVVLSTSLDLEGVAALYNKLYSVAGRQAKTDFDSFQKYLRKQVVELTRRTGCDQVRFRVSQAGGQPTLKAKPLVTAE